MSRHDVNTNRRQIEQLLDLPELADWLNTPIETLRKALSRGDGPPGTKLWNQWRFRREDVEKWLADRSRP